MNVKWWQFVLFLLIALDLAFLNYQLFQKSNNQSAVTPIQVTVPTPSTSPVPTVISETPLIITMTPTPKTKVKQITYLPINAPSSTMSNDWVSLAGTEFNFDKKDYPGLYQIDFIVNGRLFNGNGTAFFRLYDIDRGLVVDNSYVQISSQKDTLVNSTKLNFFSGNHTLVVQAKSLTADTAMLTGAKLKITSEF